MKRLLLSLLFTGLVQVLFGQAASTRIEGKVVYITSQNTYAKFESTQGILLGDTLYIQNNGGLKPAFIVEYLSSVSCSGKPVGSSLVNVDDRVVAYIPETENKTNKEPQEKPLSSAPSRLDIGNKDEKPVEGRSQLIKGRLSVISYQSYSNTTADDFQRMRYTLSFNGKYLADSRFSLESFISFAHRLGDWASIQSDLFNGLKIYNLSVNYEVSKSTSLWLGRKINPKISSLGAIDGVQAETGYKNFFFGAAVGFRPDYTDYGFNSGLFEYGAYVGHQCRAKMGSLSSSLALFQQTNAGNIDRRYAYFQIDNSLVKNLNMFLSGEVDLYTLTDGQPATALTLTSLYLSLSYRVTHQLAVYGSYDARKNVIYYETDKSYLDQLLEDATRQGVQVRVNYHPSKLMRFGLSGGYRNRKDDLKPTENATGFVTFNQLPVIKTAATLSVNWLSTSYLKGFIYGLRLSKEIIPGKLATDLNFRYIDNTLSQLTTSITQYTGEFDLQWSITQKLSFSANYEGTLETSDRYHRVYLGLIQRF